MEQGADVAGLIEKTAAGDRQAFAELYRAASPKLFAIALRMLRSSDLAEDVLQTAYLLIWRKADRFRRESGSGFAWMAAIVRNCAIDVLRSGRRTSILAEALLREDAPPALVGVDVLWTQLRSDHRLRTCLGELPEQQRRCILLAYYDGMSSR